MYCNSEEYTTAYNSALNVDKKDYIYSLSYFYSTSSSSSYAANITLDSLETLPFYKTLNVKVLTSLVLNVYLKSSTKECKFEKSANFQFKF